MKNLLALILLSLPMFAQAQFVVKQQTKVTYYSDGVRNKHLSGALTYFGHEAKKVGCLTGDFDGKVLKEAEVTHLGFGNTTPGVILFTWDTFCSNPDVIDVRYFVETIGEDSDTSTPIGIKFVTKSKGVILKTACVYGFQGGLTECSHRNVKPVWSVNR